MPDKHVIPFTFTTIGDDDGLNREAAVVVYRGAAELLRNVVKHAGATTATVSLWQSDEKQRVAVNDDGAGFAARTAGIGVLASGGFRHFQRRESLGHIGGSVYVSSDSISGTSLVLRRRP